MELRLRRQERDKDDAWIVIDGGIIVGWISRGFYYGRFDKQGWRWSINTYGHTLPEGSGGFAPDLESAKAAFKERYVQIRPQILEWEANYVEHEWKQGVK